GPAAARLRRRPAPPPTRPAPGPVTPTPGGLARARPGPRKSAAPPEPLRPLQPLITDAHIAYEQQRAAHRFRHAEHRARQQALTRRLREAVEHAAPTDDLRYAFDVLEPAIPRERRYIVNDATGENLGELRNHTPNGLLLFRDDLSGFLRLMDRPGLENDRAFFCEAWNGGGAYIYDRLGRGTLRIEAACISILGGIQPGPLYTYLQ